MPSGVVVGLRHRAYRMGCRALSGEGGLRAVRAITGMMEGDSRPAPNLSSMARRDGREFDLDIWANARCSYFGLMAILAALAH